MPYALRGEADPSGWFVIRLVVREPPPPELSLTFVDMISNLRATLDHIIWALVEESGNETHHKLTFPCVQNRERWPSWLGRQLKNVPPQWIPAMSSPADSPPAQPRRHPMNALHRLDITNKHRLLIPIEHSTFEWKANYRPNRATREGDPRIDLVAPTRTRLTDSGEPPSAVLLEDHRRLRDGDQECARRTGRIRAQA